MQDDNVFRFMMILGFVVILPIGLHHRIRSQASREKLDRRQEGPFILYTLRPIAGVNMLGLLAFMLHPPWMSWSSVAIPGPVRWAGVAIGALTILLTTWVFRSLGTNLTDTVVTREKHQLVTAGPYKWVRHPFYVAFAMSVVAGSLVTANWFIAITGGAAFCLVVLRTRIEERKLIERFGDAYLSYTERTGRFFPRRPGR